MNILTGAIVPALRVIGVSVIVVLGSAAALFDLIMNTYDGGEWPHNRSFHARFVFEKDRERLFNTGSGIKAKETFAVQELQDLIFSYCGTKQLYKMQRVCKQWQDATKGNTSHSVIQIALKKQQDASLHGTLAWVPELLGVGVPNDGTSREVMFSGTQLKFIISKDSFNHPRLTVRPGNALLHLDILVHKKPNQRESPKYQSLSDSDSRLDMVMFPAPLTSSGYGNSRVRIVSRHENYWRIITHVASKRMPNHGEDMKYTLWIKCNFHHEYPMVKWKDTKGFLKDTTCDEIPVNGTLREWLVALEKFFIAELDMSEADEPTLSGIVEAPKLALVKCSR